MSKVVGSDVDTAGEKEARLCSADSARSPLAEGGLSIDWTLRTEGDAIRHQARTDLGQEADLDLNC